MSSQRSSAVASTASADSWDSRASSAMTASGCSGAAARARRRSRLAGRHHVLHRHQCRVLSARLAMALLSFGDRLGVVPGMPGQLGATWPSWRPARERRRARPPPSPPLLGRAGAGPGCPRPDRPRSSWRPGVESEQASCRRATTVATRSSCSRQRRACSRRCSASHRSTAWKRWVPNSVSRMCWRSRRAGSQEGLEVALREHHDLAELVAVEARAAASPGGRPRRPGSTRVTHTSPTSSSARARAFSSTTPDLARREGRDHGGWRVSLQPASLQASPRGPRGARCRARACWLRYVFALSRSPGTWPKSPKQIASRMLVLPAPVCPVSRKTPGGVERLEVDDLGVRERAERGHLEAGGPS